MRKSVAAVAFIFFLISQGAVAQNIPQEIPLEEFGALAKNSNVRMSPDGTHFSIVSFIQGKKYVVVTPVGGQPIAAIPPYDGMVIDWAFWLNNDYLIIQMSFEKEAHSAFGKVNATRLISVSKDGKKVKNMAKPARVKGSRDQKRTYMPDYAGSVIDVLPDDEDHFLLSLDDDGTDMAYEIRYVDVTNGNYKVILDFYEDIQSWITDQSGKPRLGEGIRRVGASRNQEEFTMFYLPPGAAKWENYTNADVNKYDIAAFFGDPRFAYAFGRNEEGFRELYKYDMVNQERVETLYSVEGYDVGSLILDKVNGNPVGVAYTTIKKHYHYFDQALAKIQRMMDKALPGNINTLSSWTKDRTYFIVHSESDIDPGAYFLFNNKTKQLQFIEAAYEGLDPSTLVPTKPVEYEARDGLVIPAYLTLPMGREANNLPTIIMPHGGPQARDEWGYNGSTNFITQFLANRGYVVLQPNFRGSTGYGKEFADAGRENWGLKMQDDVTDGVNWLIEQGIANPNRICIIGWSYGGYSALIGTVKTPDLYKCSISINGVSSLPMLMYDDSNFLGLRTWGKHIGKRNDAEFLKANSAYYNIDKITTPILVIATRDDTRVNYAQSKDFAKKMENKGKKVRYKEIKEGGHSALEGDGRSEILIEIEKFINEHIGEGS